MGLMLKVVCESVELRIFSSPDAFEGLGHKAVEIEGDNILENMERVLSQARDTHLQDEFPFDYIERMIDEK